MRLMFKQTFEVVMRFRYYSIVSSRTVPSTWLIAFSWLILYVGPFVRVQLRFIQC